MKRLHFCSYVLFCLLALFTFISCLDQETLEYPITESSPTYKKKEGKGNTCTVKTYDLTVIIDGNIVNTHTFDNCEEGGWKIVIHGASFDNESPDIDISGLVPDPLCDKTEKGPLHIIDQGDGLATALYWYKVGQEGYSIRIDGTWSGTWHSDINMSFETYAIRSNGRHNKNCLIRDPVPVSGNIIVKVVS